MPAPIRLHTARDTCRESAVEVLRGLLAQAEAGEVIGVTGVVEFAGGTYGQFGSSTMSRLQTSGALLEAAVTRLDLEG